jgi:hypothetical protein
MVIVKIGDGLGNQMYNYACGYAAAKKNGEKLLLDISECDNSQLRDYELDKLNIDCKATVSFSNKTIFHKIRNRIWRDLFHHVIYENKNYIFLYDERVYRKKRFRNIYLHGYWQNFQFFDFCSDDIRRQFTCAYEQTDEVKAVIKKLSEDNTCAVHIRGGDIRSLNADYFCQAIHRMREHNPAVKFIVFTNDPEKAAECMELWDQDLSYEMAGNLGKFSDMDEMFIMASCRNQIISNSTYSWWAAYLNRNPDKTVIAPVRTNASSNIYPEGWTVI